MKKLLIIGHARHGKDTVAEMLNEMFGFKAKSSSIAASEIFIYDRLKEKYNYSSPEECFEDRVNHRAEWYDLICEYNQNDRSALAKEILKTADIYVGMRSNDEVEECQRQGIFDLIVGVYDYRKSEEHKGSFDINIWEKSDFVITNAGTLDDLRNKVKKLSKIF